MNELNSKYHILINILTHNNQKMIICMLIFLFLSTFFQSKFDLTPLSGIIQFHLT